MDPDPLYLNKIINSLKKRGFSKEANTLEELLTVEEPKTALVTNCPICGGPADADPNCVLCDGTGELVSVVPEDEEDLRVMKELKLTQAATSYENMNWFEKGVHLSREDLEKNQWGDLPALINALHKKPKTLDEAKAFIEGYLSIGPEKYIEFERTKAHNWLNKK